VGILGVAASVLLAPSLARADDLATEQSRLFLQRDAALGTLGAWAGVNVIAGAIMIADPPWLEGLGPTRDYRRSFGVATLSFATVNAVLAAVGAFTFFPKSAVGSTSALAQQRSTASTVFAVNAGLDVLYVGTGALLYAKATSPSLRGLGAGVMIQGSFLFGFDTSNAIVFRYAGP
jgi:hypothetical protein